MDGNINATVVNASTTARSAAFVYVALDGLLSRTMKIEVTEGEDVLSIKDKIKEKGRPTFDSVAVFDLQLFRSEEQKDFSEETTDSENECTSDNVEMPLNPIGKALLATKEWNRDTIWGTKRQPLIVKVKQVDKSATSTDEGECIVSNSDLYVAMF